MVEAIAVVVAIGNAVAVGIAALRVVTVVIARAVAIQIYRVRARGCATVGTRICTARGVTLIDRTTDRTQSRIPAPTLTLTRTIASPGYDVYMLTRVPSWP